jgi:hypothetical protein
MNFKVFNQKQEHTSVTINTEVTRSGDLILFACDQDGKALGNGHISMLNHLNGKLQRFSGCNIPGIQTDSEGRILIEDEDEKEKIEYPPTVDELIARGEEKQEEDDDFLTLQNALSNIGIPFDIFEDVDLDHANKIIVLDANYNRINFYFDYEGVYHDTTITEALAKIKKKTENDENDE